MASEVRSRALAVAAVVSCLALASPARAQSLSDKETARSLMEDGDGKRDKGDFKGALKSYEAADAIMHVPTTGLEVGRAQAALGMLLEARETLNRVERSPAKPNEPAPFAQARAQAAELSAELAARIPTITVAVKNADAGATREIFIDGEKIPAAAAEAPRKVNPGAHAVMVRAGGVEKQDKVTVAEREQKVVTIDLKPAAAPEPRAVDTSSSASSGSSSLPKILIFGGFGLGVVGIGVGSVTGLMSMSQTDDVKKLCNPKCPASSQGDIDSAKTLGNVSTVAFVVGGAGVAAGIVGLVLAGKQKETAQTAHVELGPGWAGVSGSF